LNVCCGQYGYCGVTTEFCEPGCQQPASTGLSSGSVQNIVIGYFESWNLITPTCANVDLSFIRTDSLTHLNVAFGYIQPDTYTIYPIPGTGIEQFQQLTNLKQSAPGLQIWLSLGGWTYSDNGTDTQPVFGDLASSVEKRRSFIESLVSFMTEWGFDGVDIDWEYPGAPDRNGKPEDTANCKHFQKLSLYSPAYLTSLIDLLRN
jgi:chitinase